MTGMGGSNPFTPMHIDVAEFVSRQARKLTHEKPNGRWRLPELEAAVRRAGLDRGLRVTQKPMRDLLKAGDVVRFRAGNRTEYTTPVHRVSLADLRDFAEQHVGAGGGGVGARPKDGPRRVESVTESNMTNIRAMCGKVAAFVDRTRDPEDVLDDITGHHFVWDEEEDWSSFLRLVRAAVDASDVTDETGYRYVGAARKLLDLAATHGWIARTPRHDADYEPVPAAWSDLFNDWRDELAGEGLSRVRSSLMMLLEACSRLGEHPASGDWRTVIEHLEDWFRARNVLSRERTCVRRTYRALCENDAVSGPVWDGHARQRENGVALLRHSAVRWVARRYGAGPDGNREGIRAALSEEDFPWEGWEAYEEGLASGAYGLRRALLTFTASAGEARILKLPNRATFPRVRIRGTTHRSEKPWRVVTATRNLWALLHVAGWMADERDVDWSTRDLRTLLDMDHLEAYLRKAYADEDFTTRYAALRRVGTLARLASPHLEKVAMDEGNHELADRMQHVSAKLSSSVAVDGEPSWSTILQQDLDEVDSAKSQRRKARRIEEVWTDQKAAADYAYQQLRRVLERSLRNFAEEHGELSDQVALIREGRVGRDRFDREWARRVRDLLYWQDQLVVPLRASTSRRLNTEDRKHSRDFRRVYARIGAGKMKAPGNDEFEPNYTDGGDGYCRELYRLYVMKGGARERLRTTPAGQLKDVDAFYVFDVTRSSRERMTGAAFRNLVKRVVREAEEALGRVTLDELEDAHALGTHFFRHAFGTFMARNGRMEVAALYLHHANLDMLREVYSATHAADFDVADYLERDLAEMAA